MTPFLLSPNPAYAQTGAALCGMLAVLFAWMHWRHRDPGAAWFAVGFGSVFVIYAFGLRAATAVTTAHPGATLFGALAVIGLGCGMVDYVGGSRAQRWRWRAAVALPMLVVLVAVAFQPLPRAAAHGAIAVSLTVLALMTWRASAREARIGHRLVAAALMLHPAMLLVLLATGADVYALRYLLLAPITLFGATLFAVSLSRTRMRLEEELRGRVAAQAELARLNASLEQQVAERTAELQAMVSGLASFNRSVSHDLRGPLGGIAGLTRLAAQALLRGENQRVPEMLDAVAHQADALGALVNDLLLLARVNDAPIDPQPLDLRDCVAEALQQLDIAGVPTAAVELGPLGTVRADRGLMRQLLVNLIGNALKFSRGAAAPRVQVELAEQAGQDVLRVRDNGAGFDPAQAPELFQPFHRLHRGYEGTGIGLTIVRRIAERHGGSVGAEGRPGAGATFWVALPA